MPTPHILCRIRHEPRWRPVRLYTSAQLPQACRAWLLDESSLTARLIAMNRGAFQVRRLRQGWQLPLRSECVLLGLPTRRRALIREVGLMLADQTVVFARSVFPASSLTGDLAHLRYLQNQSLGAILFGHPRMRRSPFELARIAGDSAYLPPGLRQSTPAWGRRSRFDIGGRSLMVSEVFLQDFTPWDCGPAARRGRPGTAPRA